MLLQGRYRLMAKSQLTRDGLLSAMSQSIDSLTFIPLSSVLPPQPSPLSSLSYLADTASSTTLPLNYSCVPPTILSATSSSSSGGGNGSVNDINTNSNTSQPTSPSPYTRTLVAPRPSLTRSAAGVLQPQSPMSLPASLVASPMHSSLATMRPTPPPLSMLTPSTHALTSTSPSPPISSPLLHHQHSHPPSHQQHQHHHLHHHTNSISSTLSFTSPPASPSPSPRRFVSVPASPASMTRTVSGASLASSAAAATASPSPSLIDIPHSPRVAYPQPQLPFSFPTTHTHAHGNNSNGSASPLPSPPPSPLPTLRSLTVGSSPLNVLMSASVNAAPVPVNGSSSQPGTPLSQLTTLQPVTVYRSPSIELRGLTISSGRSASTQLSPPVSHVTVTATPAPINTSSIGFPPPPITTSSSSSSPTSSIRYGFWSDHDDEDAATAAASPDQHSSPFHQSHGEGSLHDRCGSPSSIEWHTRDHGRRCQCNASDAVLKVQWLRLFRLYADGGFNGGAQHGADYRRLLMSVNELKALKLTSSKHALNEARGPITKITQVFICAPPLHCFLSLTRFSFFVCVWLHRYSCPSRFNPTIGHC
jgi:hypothetical protein